MYINKIINYELKSIGDIIKVEKKKIVWSNIKEQLLTFHNEIVEIILNPEALYFYATHNRDSKFLPFKLSEKQNLKIKKIFNLLIKNPEVFYDNYKKEEKLLKELNDILDKHTLLIFIEKYGIRYQFKDSNCITKEKNNIIKKIKKESSYGIFGEIIFYTVIEYLMENRNLFLSKISFITAPGTYSHGCDGVFCDYGNKVLYFGESKFTFDLSSGIEQALLSLNNLTDRLKQDKDFIMCHDLDIKGSIQVDVIDIEELDSYELKVIIFFLHGSEYLDEDILSLIEKAKPRFNKIFKQISFEFISFPIVNKESLKKEIAKQVSNND